ncbi:MAG TPA: hypothetical protein VKS60_09880 [Stellaceae bacterium]|nr:hypothetical protein [Stellaceae bacterium]
MTHISADPTMPNDPASTANGRPRTPPPPAPPIRPGLYPRAEDDETFVGEETDTVIMKIGGYVRADDVMPLVTELLNKKVSVDFRTEATVKELLAAMRAASMSRCSLHVCFLDIEWFQTDEITERLRAYRLAHYWFDDDVSCSRPAGYGYWCPGMTRPFGSNDDVSGEPHKVTASVERRVADKPIMPVDRFAFPLRVEGWRS